jgi:hypothetical protein
MSASASASLRSVTTGSQEGGCRRIASVFHDCDIKTAIDPAFWGQTNTIGFPPAWKETIMGFSDPAF